MLIIKNNYRPTKYLKMSKNELKNEYLKALRTARTNKSKNIVVSGNFKIGDLINLKVIHCNLHYKDMACLVDSKLSYTNYYFDIVSKNITELKKNLKNLGLGL